MQKKSHGEIAKSVLKYGVAAWGTASKSNLDNSAVKDRRWWIQALFNSSDDILALRVWKQTISNLEQNSNTSVQKHLRAEKIQTEETPFSTPPPPSRHFVDVVGLVWFVLLRVFVWWWLWWLIAYLFAFVFILFCCLLLSFYSVAHAGGNDKTEQMQQLHKKHQSLGSPPVWKRDQCPETETVSLATSQRTLWRSPEGRPRLHGASLLKRALDTFYLYPHYSCRQGGLSSSRSTPTVISIGMKKLADLWNIEGILHKDRKALMERHGHLWKSRREDDFSNTHSTRKCLWLLTGEDRAAVVKLRTGYCTCTPSSILVILRCATASYPQRQRYTVQPTWFSEQEPDLLTCEWGRNSVVSCRALSAVQ